MTFLMKISTKKDTAMRKYTFISFLLIPLFVACNKESNNGVDNTESVIPFTIEAVIDNDDSDLSKTTFTSTGKFSWVIGDQIDIAVYKTSEGPTSKADKYTLASTAVSGDGYTATFTGGYTSDNFSDRVGGDYTEHEYAFYPGNDVLYWKTYWTNTNHYVHLWEQMHDVDQKVPMIAKKLDDGKYHFSTSVGVIKLCFSDIPAAKGQFGVTSRTGSISGFFNVVDTDNKAVIQNTTVGGNSATRYVDYTPASVESKDFIIPLPVGTTLDGMKIFIKDETGNVLYSTITKRTLGTVARGQMYVTPTLTYTPTTFNKAAVLGTYTTAVASGPYSGNYATGDMVIEDSDDGIHDVMITKFAGVTGKIYGNLDTDHWTITFPWNQSFGDNPYADAGSYPELALVSFTGSAIDLVLHYTSSGKLVCLSDALGFRAIKDAATWESTRAGGWPWDLCYTYFSATKK